MIPALDLRRAVRVVAGDVEHCDASGWKVRRTSCADHHGRTTCPMCGRRVRTRVAGPRIVELDHHRASRS